MRGLCGYTQDCRGRGAPACICVYICAHLVRCMFAVKYASMCDVYACGIRGFMYSKQCTASEFRVRSDAGVHVQAASPGHAEAGSDDPPQAARGSGADLCWRRGAVPSSHLDQLERCPQS